MMNRLTLFQAVAAALCCGLISSVQGSDSLLIVTDVEYQPLAAQVERVSQALELAGAPLTAEGKKSLAAAIAIEDRAKAARAIQEVLDPLCLVGVEVNPESRVKVQPGVAAKELIEQGWRVFLIKVNNQAQVTSPLHVSSPNAALPYDPRRMEAEPPQTVTQADVAQRWLDLSFYNGQPLNERLSGLKLEYRVIELFSRDRGNREAKLSFDVGQGTQDLGYRNEVNLLFKCEPSTAVKLGVLDQDGTPTTGQFIFRDARDRVYPARSKRMSPDFAFHDQIYRQNGDEVLLPPGEYQVTYSRGPEYRQLTKHITVPRQATHSEEFQLERWINQAANGWNSGDHHIHAAGCAHYASPTQGSKPEDMLRHIVGEDLNVGCVLTWGPCWYYQKQFFDGQTSPLSTAQNLMRYDVEVSGFPSSPSGHIVLLRIKEDDYPGTTRIEQWPSWDLPILKWGKEQGGIVGFAHSGWGLAVPATKLPTYEMPAFDGVGANEYIVDVAHDACDFISSVDTPAIWELSIWYHTLNCGFTTRISGETDFPCIYGDRVGLGRVYVKQLPGETLDFDKWILGVRDGRSYCCDGRTHLFDFQIDGFGVGERGDKDRASFLAVQSGQKLKIKSKVAGLLDENPASDEILTRPLDKQPYWTIERARVKGTRQVPVELIVNGNAVEADGRVEEIEFEYTPERSSWIALRVFPAAHTNPIFVEVGGKPIRPSKRSAKWCLEAVDRCWAAKKPVIRKEELAAAEAAYDHAREVYRKIVVESFDDGAKTAAINTKPAAK